MTTASQTIPPGPSAFKLRLLAFARSLGHDTSKITGGTNGHHHPLLTFAPESRAIDYRFLHKGRPMATAAATAPAHPQCEPVTISPDSGEFAQSVKVLCECPTPGSSIYFTIDGKDPDESSPLYMSPVTISKSCTFKAKAFASETLPSAVTANHYEIL